MPLNGAVMPQNVQPADVQWACDGAGTPCAAAAIVEDGTTHPGDTTPALEGEVVPQSVRLPLATTEDPNFKDGENFYADQSDNFFVGNSFPTCGINFTAQEIMGQSEANK